MQLISVAGHPYNFPIINDVLSPDFWKKKIPMDEIAAVITFDLFTHKTPYKTPSRPEISCIVPSARACQRCRDITEWNWVLLFYSLLAITKHFWHVRK